MLNNSSSMVVPSNNTISTNGLLRLISESEKFILPFLLLVGTTCNVLTFIVMRRGRMRLSSSCFYMAILAVTDSCVLWIGCLNRWLELLEKSRPILACNICCKLCTFLFFFFADCSVWITVAMTIERYIAVSRPLKASQLCTVKRAKYVLLTIFLLFFLINSHFLWTFHLSFESYCMPVNDNSLFIKYFTWIDSCKYSFLPFLMLISLNILIIRSLLHSRQNSKLLQQSTTSTTYSISFSSSSTSNNGHANNHTLHHNHNYRRVNRRLTSMLLTVSFAFCICSMPISIMQIIDAIYPNIDKRSVQLVVTISIGKIIAEISQYINHSINFFLYAFTGRIFRHELHRLFLLCFCHHRLQYPYRFSTRKKSARQQNESYPNTSRTITHQHRLSTASDLERTRRLSSIALTNSSIYPHSSPRISSVFENCRYSLLQRFSENDETTTTGIATENSLHAPQQRRTEPRISNVSNVTTQTLLDFNLKNGDTDINENKTKMRSALITLVETMKNQSHIQKSVLKSPTKNYLYGVTDTVTHRLL